MIEYGANNRISSWRIIFCLVLDKKIIVCTAFCGGPSTGIALYIAFELFLKILKSLLFLGCHLKATPGQKPF